jgi:hypothetical protein
MEELKFVVTALIPRVSKVGKEHCNGNWKI